MGDSDELRKLLRYERAQHKALTDAVQHLLYYYDEWPVSRKRHHDTVHIQRLRDLIDMDEPRPEPGD